MLENTIYRYNKRLDKIECNRFNAGVVGFNLNKWRNEKVFDEVVYWMKENVKKKLWVLGTQPVLYAVSVGDLQVVTDRRWNILDLGAALPVSEKWIKKGFIIHWNGKSK